MIYNYVWNNGGHTGFKMSLQDALALEAAVLEGGDGDYLEIGVRKGGSAIFAALIKKAAGQSGVVYGIDSMGSRMAAKGVTPDALAVRAEKFGVVVNLVNANSDPWPMPEDVRPVMAVIDGNHSHEAASADWRNLKDRTRRFILFHDCDQPPVAEAIEEAKLDKGWSFVGAFDHMAVFERCASS